MQNAVVQPANNVSLVAAASHAIAKATVLLPAPPLLLLLLSLLLLLLLLLVWPANYGSIAYDGGLEPTRVVSAYAVCFMQCCLQHNLPVIR
jgi:hypothetical protein